MSSLRKLIQVPRFYPAEYVLVLVSSLVVLLAGGALASMLVAEWLNCTAPSVVADMSVLLVLAVLIVALPVHLVLYARVSRADRSKLTPLALRTASAATALYVFVAGAAVVALAVWLVWLWLEAIIGTGTFDRELATHTISLLVAIGLLKYGILHFLRQRVGAGQPVLYLVSVAVVGLALIVLGFAFPVQTYRGAANDFVKETDLAKIQHAVNGYVSEHAALPDNLEQLDNLSKNTAGRLNDYKYTPHGDTVLGIFGYELCATFATSGRDFGFPAREKGEQCKPYIAVSGQLLEQGLTRFVHGIEDGADRLGRELASFLRGAEAELGGQISGLERYLSGVEVSTGGLLHEMQRLEGRMSGLTDDTSQLAQDFAAVEKFIGDLLCALDPECNGN